MIHHPQAPQMAKQITIRGNIKHDLLFSALGNINGIFRKMKYLGEEGVEYENMTRPGIFVLLHRPPGTVQSNMKTRQRIFYKFSLSGVWSHESSPELMPRRREALSYTGQFRSATHRCFHTKAVTFIDKMGFTSRFLDPTESEINGFLTCKSQQKPFIQFH